MEALDRNLEALWAAVRAQRGPAAEPLRKVDIPPGTGPKEHLDTINTDPENDGTHDRGIRPQDDSLDSAAEGTAEASVKPDDAGPGFFQRLLIRFGLVR